MKHPATIISIVALFSSLTGGALASGLINGHSIKAHTIPLSALTPAAVASLHGKVGPAGPAGATGTFDADKVTRVVGAPVDVAPHTTAAPIVSCPAGTIAIGGGGAAGIARVGSFPVIDQPSGSNTPTGWAALVYNDTDVQVQAQAVVVCASR